MTRYWSHDRMVRYGDTGDKPGRLQAIVRNTNKILDYRLEGSEQEAIIISDPEVSPVLYHTMAGELQDRGIEVSISLIPQQHLPNQEPPSAIADAVTAVDLIVNMCSYTISHTEAIEHAREEFDIKYLLLANPTEDTFSQGAIEADPEAVTRLTTKVAYVLQHGEEVHVTADNGTDVRFSLAGRDQLVAKFPMGETPTCPVEESVEGTIVHDSYLQTIGILEDPVTWEVENGRIVEISGGREAERLRHIVEERGDDNARWIGEFSVMTQPHARPNGNEIEHKQVAGGVHFALGDGKGLGGAYESSLHLDGIQLSPTVLVDGQTLVDAGRINEDVLPEEPVDTSGMRVD